MHSNRKQISGCLELGDTDLITKGPEVSEILIVLVVIWEYILSEFI